MFSATKHFFSFLEATLMETVKYSEKELGLEKPPLALTYV